MGSVTNIATRRPQSSQPRNFITFEHNVDDYSALTAARAYLDARGFAVAEQQGNNPQGFMLGDERPKKWSQLSPEEATDMHGWITSADFRRGDITIAIRDDVHSSVIEAFRSTEPEGGTADPVGVDLADRHPVIDGLEGEHHPDDVRAREVVEGRRRAALSPTVQETKL